MGPVIQFLMYTCYDDILFTIFNKKKTKILPYSLVMIFQA